MSAPNRWFNTFLYSLIGGILIYGLVYFSNSIFGSTEINFLQGVLLFFLIPFLILFGILSIAFRSFFKINISQLYDLLPDLNSDTTAKNIESLSEQINTLTDDKSKEINTLTERENYRREFLGNVSHELKTPLFSIQGYLLTLIEGGI